MNITGICMDLHNFFPPVSKRADKSYIHRGHFIISGSSIAPLDFIKKNQYFRIVGSDMNDGVWQNTPDDLQNLIDEDFEGEIWAMAVPHSFLELCEDIQKWRDKYEKVDSENMSPFTSESFGGYSYSKGSSNSMTWEAQFASRLKTWRKI